MNGVHSQERAADGYDRLIRDLNEERAAVLRRISGRLDALIGQLHDARARVATLDGLERARERDRYADLRRMAGRYRWYLEVQRESLGLRAVPATTVRGAPRTSTR